MYRRLVLKTDSACKLICAGFAGSLILYAGLQDRGSSADRYLPKDRYSSRGSHRLARERRPSRPLLLSFGRVGNCLAAVNVGTTGHDFYPPHGNRLVCGPVHSHRDRSAFVEGHCAPKRASSLHVRPNRSRCMVVHNRKFQGLVFGSCTCAAHTDCGRMFYICIAYRKNGQTDFSTHCPV